MWRYPGDQDYLLSSKFDIFILARRLFDEQNQSSNLLGMVTWSVLYWKKKSACEKAQLNFLLNIGSQWVKSNYISVWRDFLGKATEALRRNFLTYRFVDIWVSDKFHILCTNNSRFCALRKYPRLKMEKHTMGAFGKSASETSVTTCKQK